MAELLLPAQSLMLMLMPANEIEMWSGDEEVIAGAAEAAAAAASSSRPVIRLPVRLKEAHNSFFGIGVDLFRTSKGIIIQRLTVEK